MGLGKKLKKAVKKAAKAAVSATKSFAKTITGYDLIKGAVKTLATGDLGNLVEGAKDWPGNSMNTATFGMVGKDGIIYDTDKVMDKIELWPKAEEATTTVAETDDLEGLYNYVSDTHKKAMRRSRASTNNTSGTSGGSNTLGGSTTLGV